MSPTITTPAMTQAGVILGTAAYMSPEQAKGRHADKRSDVWAFGCVLFEMLAGRRIFRGDDVTDVLVAVLSQEPDWTALPAATPPAIHRVLRRSLERDRRRRLADIADARLELDEALIAPAIEAVPAAGPRAALWQPSDAAGGVRGRRCFSRGLGGVDDEAGGFRPGHTFFDHAACRRQVPPSRIDSSRRGRVARWLTHRVRRQWPAVPSYARSTPSRRDHGRGQSVLLLRRTVARLLAGGAAQESVRQRRRAHRPVRVSGPVWRELGIRRHDPLWARSGRDLASVGGRQYT